jgi:hypothetical protein
MNSVNWRRNLSADTYRTPSPAIWADCPVRDLIEDPGKGLYFFDDFQDLPLAPTLTTQIAFGKYKAYAASGCTINRLSAVNSVELQGGCLKVGMDTDNDEASIAQAYASYLLSGLTSNSGKLWFECCYAQNSVATNMASVFVGLAETDAFTLAANAPHNSGDAIDNSGSMIGFRIEEDGLGVIDTVVSDRATSFTNIGDTEAGTLTANTFRKLGFVYDPAGPSDSVITFYANNQALTTKISKSTLTGYTNLDANSLGLLLSVAADSAGTSFEAYLKWWRVAQLFPVGV